MTATQNILRAGVSVQAASLLGMNLKAAKKNLKSKKKGNDLKRILKTGVGNIVGIPILTAQSKLIGDIV